MSATLAAAAAGDVQSTWFRHASVRTMTHAWRDRGRDFDWRFPVEMKPLLGHAAIAGLPLPVRKFINVQAFHKYLHDVCLTETDVVNPVAAAIAYGRSAAVLPGAMAAEAFSVMVDEAFHSYVARLFSLHIAEVTGIESVRMPPRNALLCAYEDVGRGLPPRIVAMAELLCCCLSESNFTKEILVASRLEGYDPAFREIMVDHLADEGRHYGYFRRVLTRYWYGLSEQDRCEFAGLLPAILKTQFSDALDTEFDRRVLLIAGLEEPVVEKCLSDVDSSQLPVCDRPRVRNSLEFLRLCGVLEHDRVRQRLEDEGLLVGQTSTPSPVTSSIEHGARRVRRASVDPG